MASSKEQEEKDFLISKRKKIAAGLTSAPVWVMQKSNKRIWNPKGKRHWSQTDFGDEFRKSFSRKRKGDNACLKKLKSLLCPFQKFLGPQNLKGLGAL